MINYYTNKKDLPKDKEFIEIVDLYFRTWIARNGLNKQDEIILQEIDKSKFSSAAGWIETPFGAINYNGISTGCKTIILLKHLGQSHIINIQECGPNVIDYIFEHLDNINVYSNGFKVLSIPKHGLSMNGEQVTSLENINKYWKRS